MNQKRRLWFKWSLILGLLISLIVLWVVALDEDRERVETFVWSSEEVRVQFGAVNGVSWNGLHKSKDYSRDLVYKEYRFVVSGETGDCSVYVRLYKVGEVYGEPELHEIKC